MKISTYGKESTPYVWITSTAHAKIHALVGMARKEVGWLGSVQSLSDTHHKYLIEDIFLFEQTVHATETEIDKDDLLKFATEYPGDLDKIKFWGHSHVDMGVNPSGTDTTTMETFMENNDFFIMGIFNKRGETRLDLYADGFVYESLPLIMHYEGIEDLRKEFKEKVHEVRYQTTQFRSGHYQAPQNGNRHNRSGGNGQQDLYDLDEDWMGWAFENMG